MVHITELTEHDIDLGISCVMDSDVCRQISYSGSEHENDIMFCFTIDSSYMDFARLYLKCGNDLLMARLAWTKRQ